MTLTKMGKKSEGKLKVAVPLQTRTRRQTAAATMMTRKRQARASAENRLKPSSTTTPMRTRGRGKQEPSPNESEQSSPSSSSTCSSSTSSDMSPENASAAHSGHLSGRRRVGRASFPNSEPLTSGTAVTSDKSMRASTTLERPNLSAPDRMQMPAAEKGDTCQAAAQDIWRTAKSTQIIVTAPKSNTTIDLPARTFSGRVVSSEDGMGVRVKVTPSGSVRSAKQGRAGRQRSSKPLDHNYDVPGAAEWQARMQTSQLTIERLRKDRKYLRTRLYRAEKKIDKLLRSLVTEQRMHNETQQTLRAIMQSLQLEVVS